MAVDDIVAFLQQRLSEGYTMDSLRRYLVQQGIYPNEISAAINSVNAKVPRKHSTTKIVAVALFFVGTIISIIAVFIYFMPQTDAPKNIQLNAGLSYRPVRERKHYFLLKNSATRLSNLGLAWGPSL